MKKEVAKKKPAKVWVSGVCDPYQPLEEKYEVTRKCLEILAQNDWSVVIQTRSPLILRDVDILGKGKYFEAGFSVTTADDRVRKMFEPHAPSIQERINALEYLHEAGIKTYAMIAPILPGAEDLAELLAGKIDYVILDRMNYQHADWVYREHNLWEKKSDAYFESTERILTASFSKLGIGKKY